MPPLFFYKIVGKHKVLCKFEYLSKIAAQTRRLIFQICLYILPYGLTIIPLLLPIDCLSIALDAHMLSHHGYGPGTRT